MDASIVVVIAAVPERADNLQLLLDDLSDQTTRIDAVQLVLNGWSDEAAEQMQMLHQRRGRMFPLHIDTSTVRRAAGYRWSIVKTLSPDTTFLAALDDDLRVHPDYLRRTVTAFESPTVGLVSWTGNALD
jgi:cellulose synthase/poly-beta-1,6-N-acetylglucosamine synthase-like glycosyltransferase